MFWGFGAEPTQFRFSAGQWPFVTYDDSVDKSITSRQENDQALLGVMTIG